MPLDERLFNCALASLRRAAARRRAQDAFGQLQRVFTSAAGLRARMRLSATRSPCLRQTAPSGTDVLLEQAETGLLLGVELCEDAWVPLPPSLAMCAAGARAILNLSASNDIVAKTEYRRDMLSMLSARGVCAYAYASSGAGESRRRSWRSAAIGWLSRTAGCLSETHAGAGG